MYLLFTKTMIIDNIKIFKNEILIKCECEIEMLILTLKYFL